MSVFEKNKKKKLALIETSSELKKCDSLEDFVKSGAGDTTITNNKNKGGRPKRTGEKPVLVSLYLSPAEKDRFQKEADKLHIGLSAYLKMKLYAEV